MTWIASLVLVIGITQYPANFHPNIDALEPEIGQVLVHGDQRPHLVALFVPAQRFVNAYAKVDGKRHELVEDRDFQEVIGAAMKRINNRLSPIERIRRFKIMHEPVRPRLDVVSGSQSMWSHHP